MSRAHGPKTVMVVVATLALAGCGAATASPPNTTRAGTLDALRLSANKLVCTTTSGRTAAPSSASSAPSSATTTTTCTVRVTYTNASTTRLDFDASQTRVLDAAGELYRATAVGSAPGPRQLTPGSSASYTWAFVVPTGVTPASVRWTGDLGDTATAVISTASATPSPTPTPTLTPTPASTPSPTSTPTPTSTPSRTTSAPPTKKPSSGGGQTSRPKPSSSKPSGSIG